MEDEPVPHRQPVAGDVVVTKVADRYHLGRVQVPGRPWASIKETDGLSNLLSLACRLVSGSQRVLLYDRGGSLHCIAIDCANNQRPERSAYQEVT